MFMLYNVHTNIYVFCSYAYLGYTRETTESKLIHDISHKLCLNSNRCFFHAIFRQISSIFISFALGVCSETPTQHIAASFLIIREEQREIQKKEPIHQLIEISRYIQIYVRTDDSLLFSCSKVVHKI